MCWGELTEKSRSHELFLVKAKGEHQGFLTTIHSFIHCFMCYSLPPRHLDALEIVLGSKDLAQASSLMKGRDITQITPHSNII